MTSGESWTVAGITVGDYHAAELLASATADEISAVLYAISNEGFAPSVAVINLVTEKNSEGS